MLDLFRFVLEYILKYELFVFLTYIIKAINAQSCALDNMPTPLDTSKKTGTTKSNMFPFEKTVNQISKLRRSI